MALSDYFNGPKHRARAQQLEQDLARLSGEKALIEVDRAKFEGLAKQFGAMEMVEVQRLIDSERVRLQHLRVEGEVKAREVQATKDTLTSLQSQVLAVEETILLETFALYLPKFALTNSAAYKARLDEVRASQKEMVKNETAAIGGQGWTVNNSATEGRKLVKDMTKLMIRSFNRRE